MNLIAAVTNFFRPAPAVVMQDDHAFLLDDPTIVEMRDSIPVSDVKVAAMNRHSQAVLQNMHYTQAYAGLVHVTSPHLRADQHPTTEAEFPRPVRVNLAQARAVFNTPPDDVTVVVGPAGTFPLPDDAQLHHSAERPLAESPLYAHDIAYLIQRGEKVVKPEFDPEAPRIKMGEVDDHLANNTGAGCPRSMLMYQLNLIRDAVASAQNQNRDVGYELDPKIIELYEDSFSAFVHEKMSNTVTLICQLYNEDRNGLFETVENLGYTLWTPDKGKNLYLKILTRTAKIHL